MVPTRGSTKVGGHGDIDSFVEFNLHSLYNVPFAWRRVDSKMLCHPSTLPTVSIHLRGEIAKGSRFTGEVSSKGLKVHSCQSGLGPEISILDNKLPST